MDPDEDLVVVAACEERKELVVLVSFVEVGTLLNGMVDGIAFTDLVVGVDGNATQYQLPAYIFVVSSSVLVSPWATLRKRSPGSRYNPSRHSDSS